MQYLEERGLLNFPNEETESRSQVHEQVDPALITNANPVSKIRSNHPSEDDGDHSDGSDMDIEAAIKRELSLLTDTSMTVTRTQLSSTNAGASMKSPPKPFQLITLDIPCVSFLRFNPLHSAYNTIDPVTIVHALCEHAMSTGIMQSRFIRRLSPISWLAKTLAGGLEKCCTMVLPQHFQQVTPPKSPQPSSSPISATAAAATAAARKETETVSNTQGLTFAIKPSIRNNDKTTRDKVIRYIADEVGVLGNGVHKVDLKNYQRAILVEVYRGWIGMSVVQGRLDETADKEDGIAIASASVTGTVGDVEMGTSADEDGKKGVEKKKETQFKYGYEELKRFNLAEIYAEAWKRKEGMNE